MVNKDLKHLSADGRKGRKKRPAATRKKKKGGRAPRLRLPWGWLILTALALGGGYFLYTLFASGAVEQRIEQARQKQAQEKAPELVPAPEQGPPVLPRHEEGERRFGFYDDLQQQEVVIPESEIRALQEGTHPRENTIYYLQAGSFRRFEEAEALRARLAFLGIESKVQKVAGQGDAPWFRVRVGPFESYRQLNRVRNRLQHADIESMAIRVRQPSE